MPVVVNIIASCSGVGKTTLIEGVIRELTSRGYSLSTIKHDVHGFDIDKEGKDTYRHRKAGASQVFISSKNRVAMIKEVQEETKLEDIIKMASDTDFIIIEGYKNSKYKKIEVFRSKISKEIITLQENLIAIASDIKHEDSLVPVIDINNYYEIANIIQNLK
jgi:molybdopterin-guanine dinucleotide biosynthesis protein B